MSRFGAVNISETLEGLLVGTAKTVLWLGALATLLSVGLLVFTVYQLGGGSPAAADVAQGLRNVEIFQKILVAGVVGLSVGATFMFWGEELLGAAQLLVAGALFFAPLYLPGMLGNNSNEATDRALGALQTGGGVFGVLAIVVLIVNIGLRINLRVRVGTKADQLKYGKGIREERDRRNVFLGKCWQLPYCRKFVRERCPIYLSQRTCWKELVGCMCEEQVIRNAMENKPIPKDALLAANFIPHNHKLTIAQKRSRCLSCVIYNHHQQHKYKLGMFLIITGFGGCYWLLHAPLYAGVEGLMLGINKVVNHATLGAGGKFEPPQAFVEVMLAVFMLVVMAYAIRIWEFTCFKLKV